ncbi:AAA family ATPase [Halomonas sp. HL-93]|uniref:AAA family ATPase n=1 Tax=Halomonas sp. HL-93 TaxID=1666906 RepID=UPI0006DB9DC8|nr:AAA family ATPase [Halomonas sp. HL-93]KPQ19678.1 MAG: 5-methylcytosine-specific restriction enzyme subunit McrB [Halomonas sp. HL-93]SBR52023.1 AAA domain (dynein-related subfamily) [Halomonas sp. HL-93]
MSFEPVMKLLYGPPGTGKTWKAAREAVRAVEPNKYHAAKGDDEKIAVLHDQLVNSGRILWVTFHPSFSYEDFIEGYRPLLNKSNDVVYDIVSGPFLNLCKLSEYKNDLEVGEVIESSGKKYEVLQVIEAGWLILVRPERSDSVGNEQRKFVLRDMIETAKSKGLKPDVFSLPGSGMKNLHDCGIDPSDPDVLAPNVSNGETDKRRVGSTIRRIVAERLGVSSSDLSNVGHYRAVYSRISELANYRKSQNVAIVIDEINRADLSRVFGELLTLLEKDKRKGEKNERKVWLPYSQELFSVPRELSVIGTMNTADKSLTSMDFAMRRRFSFELVDADPSFCPDDFGGVDVRAILSTINSRLDILMGKDFRIGHAQFMEESLLACIIENNWEGSADKELKAIAYVWRKSLIPTIEEYFRQDWRKVRAVAGVSSHDENIISLFREKQADGHLLKNLPEDFELEDAISYEFESWWDPENSMWDPIAFESFLKNFIRL